ncbi:MAG: transcriptional repressor [Clostridiales bacterium]|nr:transcriptional repressor [Clostridiales bacterium]
MAKNYNTKQKHAINKAIFSIKDGHFTCEDICLKLNQTGENVGLTTVYRYIKKMVEEGKLRKYNSGAGESVCYQLMDNCGEHFHLKCFKCGKLVHLSCESLEIISKHVEDHHGFFIDPSKTVFYGTCAECEQ